MSTAGYYHLETGQFDYNRTNPPLAKLLSAVPLLSLDLELPPASSIPSTWSEVDQWKYARQFLYENNAEPQKILLFARLPFVILGLMLGYYVYRWAKDLYGPRAALFSLFLFAFSPNLLAHTRLATQDLALAAFVFISAYYLWHFIERPSWRSLLSSSALFGLAIASKTTAIFLAVPLLFLILFGAALGRIKLRDNWDIGFLQRVRSLPAREFLHLALALGVAGLVVLFVLNATYGFGEPMISAGDYGVGRAIQSKITELVPALSPLLDLALKVPLLIPESFAKVLEFQASRVASGNNVFFHGALSTQGWWYVIPVAFLIKTPIPVLVLSTVAAAMLLYDRSTKLGEWMLVAMFVFVMCLFSYLSSVSVGIRYVLLAYPCLHVLGSRFLREGVDLRPAHAVAIALLGIWCAAGTLIAYPNYLPFFNESIGGSKNGYKYLADSFVDWGQDLPALKAYMDENDIEKVRLAYFGSGDANYYGINYEYLPSVGLAPKADGQLWWYESAPEQLPDLDLSSGPIVVSVTLLAGVFYPGYYAPLADLQPIDNIGHSMVVFEASGQ